MTETKDLLIAGRPCSNTSIKELVRADNSDRPIESIIRDLARSKLQEADELLSEIDDNWSPPPFKPHLIAHALNIRIENVDDPSVDDAMIYLKDGVPTIKVRNGRPQTRINFSIAHDITHTFFPGYHNTIQHRRPKKRDLMDASDQLEYLCDIGAAELLMPMNFFMKDVDQRRFGYRLVDDLCERYGVSPEAVCIRMVHSDVRECAGGVFEPMVPSSETRSCMHSTYLVRSPSFQENWGRGMISPVSPQSCIDRTAQCGYSIKAVEDIFTVTGIHKFTVETVSLPARRFVDSPRVFAFFLPMQ